MRRAHCAERACPSVSAPARARPRPRRPAGGARAQPAGDSVPEAGRAGRGAAPARLGVGARPQSRRGEDGRARAGAPRPWPSPPRASAAWAGTSARSRYWVLSRGRAGPPPPPRPAGWWGPRCGDTQAKPWAHLPLGLLGDPAPLPDDALPVPLPPLLATPPPPPAHQTRPRPGLSPASRKRRPPPAPAAGSWARGGEVPTGLGARPRGTGPRRCSASARRGTGGRVGEHTGTTGDLEPDYRWNFFFFCL